MYLCSHEWLPMPLDDQVDDGSCHSSNSLCRHGCAPLISLLRMQKQTISPWISASLINISFLYMKSEGLFILFIQTVVWLSSSITAYGHIVWLLTAHERQLSLYIHIWTFFFLSFGNPHLHYRLRHIKCPWIMRTFHVAVVNIFIPCLDTLKMELVLKRSF